MKKKQFTEFNFEVKRLQYYFDKNFLIFNGV